MYQGPFTYERVIGDVNFSISDAKGAPIAICVTSEESAKFIVDFMNRGATVTYVLRDMPSGEEEKALKNLGDFLSSKLSSKI